MIVLEEETEFEHHDGFIETFINSYIFNKSDVKHYISTQDENINLEKISNEQINKIVTWATGNNIEYQHLNES